MPLMFLVLTAIGKTLHFKVKCCSLQSHCLNSHSSPWNYSYLMTSGHTDAEAQLRTTPPTDSIGVSEETHSPTEALNSAQSEAPTSYSSPHSPPPTPDSESSDVQPARFLGGAQSSSGGIELITANVSFFSFGLLSKYNFGEVY